MLKISSYLFGGYSSSPAVPSPAPRCITAALGYSKKIFITLNIDVRIVGLDIKMPLSHNADINVKSDGF